MKNKYDLEVSIFNSDDSKSPYVLPFENQKIKLVKCGENFTSILTSSGNVYSCGCNISSQIGIFNDNNNKPFNHTCNIESKFIAVGIRESIVDLACGSSHQLFLSRNGCVYSCGNKSKNLLGYCSDKNVGKPKKIDWFTSSKRIIYIAASRMSSFFIDINNNIYACGNVVSKYFNIYNFNNNQNEIIKKIPANFFNGDKIVEILTNCVAGHVFLMARNGNVYCFGKNDSGQLGLGHKNDISVPVKFNDYFKFGKIKSISVGGWSTMIQNDSNHVYSFGWNNGGRLGLSKVLDIVVQPKQIKKYYNDIPDLKIEGVSYKQNMINIVKIKCCTHNCFAWNDNGELYSFGNNYFNQLSHKYDGNFAFPCKMFWNFNIIQVSSGYGHTVYLSDKNEIIIAGNNSDGQIGIGKVCKKVKFKMFKIPYVEFGGLEKKLNEKRNKNFFCDIIMKTF